MGKGKGESQEKPAQESNQKKGKNQGGNKQAQNTTSQKQESKVKKSSIFPIGIPVNNDVLFFVHQFFGLLLYFKLNPYTLGAGAAAIILFKPKDPPQAFIGKEFVAFLKQLFIMLILLEVDNTSHYIIANYNPERLDYKPIRDAFYDLMRYLFPWWDKYIFSNVFPGLDNYFGFCLYLFVAAICKRVGTRKMSLWRWACLFCKLNTYLRYVRILAFYLLIIPNPRENCYKYKYPTHNSFYEIISHAWVPSNVGGCNDLLISGHGALALAILYSLYGALGGWGLKVISWVTVPLFINIVMEKFHYSVDIVFAVLFCHLFYKILLREYSDPDVFEDKKKVKST